MNFDDYFFENTIIFDIENDFLKLWYSNEIPKEKTHQLLEYLQILTESKMKTIEDIRFWNPTMSEDKAESYWWHYASLKTK